MLNSFAATVQCSHMDMTLVYLKVLPNGELSRKDYDNEKVYIDGIRHGHSFWM
jgi:hypothetical protein